MDHRLLMPRRMGGFSPLSYGSDLALWLDPSYGIYTDRSTQLTAASSQYWSVASNATLQSGNVNFWFGLWFYRDSATTYAGLVQKASAGSMGDWQCFNDGGLLYFDMLTPGGVLCGRVTTAAPATGSWNFCLVWQDVENNTVNIKLNNNATVSAARTETPLVSTEAMTVGSFSNGTYYHDGRIDSVMFGKSPPGGIAGVIAAINTSLFNSNAGKVYADLTAAEKTAWGLVSAYDFDGDGLDSHGTNDLTAVNSPTYTSGIASGTAGDGDLVSLIVPRVGPNLVPPSYAGRPTWYANGGKPYISFDGVNDGLQTASNISLGAFTIAGNMYAVQPVGAWAGGMLVEHGPGFGVGDGSFLYGGDTGTNQVVIWADHDNSSMKSNGHSFGSATWATLVQKCDGTHAGHLLRVNSVNETFADYAVGEPTVTAVADKLYLGMRLGGTYHVNGRIGDLCAVNANLSAAQLAQLEPWLIARRSA